MVALRRVLIANRGEIAVRIARAAEGLGIDSVSVHAGIDSESMHTRASTETVLLGPADGDPVAQYLDIERLIEIAKSTGCDSVHPGYGFLSESAAFALRCAEEGLTFIGPSADVLLLFGDKVQAKTLARSLGVAVIDGSEAPVASASDAEAVAGKVGYPVMLKAAAGGGGRGMRIVEASTDMAEAFDRCRSEATAAFGDGAVFVERLIQRPRHIEVQVLADNVGETVHLYDRDCSVQLRNQKVVEVAPAPHLDPNLRAALHADALKLVSAAGYENAGTVEFLISPETGEHFFIECNPRIQVEHTVTEQVMGIDLVEAQFRIAGGESLAAIGLGTQDEIGGPRGFAVQARLVMTGTGVLSAYKEPSGPGVRVDANGYAGYAPPPQFDPLLAKVICTSNSASVEAAIDRTRRAVEAFHLAGAPTNQAQLAAILSHADVRAGTARTSLLTEHPGLVAPAHAEPSAAVALLDTHAPAGRAGATGTPGEGGFAAANAKVNALPDLQVGDGHQVIDCPMASSVIEIRVDAGDTVAQGDILMVITAMKMETMISSPVSGTVSALQPLSPGDTLEAGAMLAVIEPDQSVVVETTSTAPTGENTWGPTLTEVRTLQGLADKRLGPESQERGVVRQRDRGKLNCRQRIALLLDDDSFREVGSLAGFASYDDYGEISAFTPANHVGGQGKIDERSVIVCADDFTSRGGHSDGAIGAKSLYLDRLSVELGMPSVRLLDGSSGGGSVASMVPEQKKDGASSAKESSGAITAGRPRVAGGGGSFLPGHLGSGDYTHQLSEVPVVNMLLGSVVGLGAAKAVLGHFSVMVRDISQLFVAGPPVVSHAMQYDVTKEDLGGWHIHCTNGSVDNLAETEVEAADMTRKFLSYLPPSVHEAPPVLPSSSEDPPDRREEELFTIVPRNRTTTFDMRRAIELIVDKDSFFEIGKLWGSDQITGFVRIDGHPLGVIASDSRHENGGALTADGCDKLTRHIDLCDTFHLPILNLCDNPGFAVGVEHEIRSTIRKGAEWMVAFAQISVPLYTVLMRRSFGVAGNNYATPVAHQQPRVCWPAADVGGIPPEGGIEAAYKRQLADAEDPVALRAEIDERIEAARGPIGPLSRFQIEEMIDPRDTRRYVSEWVRDAYRVVNQPGRLGPRALQFRP